MRRSRPVTMLAAAGLAVAVLTSLPTVGEASAGTPGEEPRPDDLGHHTVPYDATGPWWSTDPALPADHVHADPGLPEELVAAARVEGVRVGLRTVEKRRGHQTYRAQWLVLTWRLGDVLPPGRRVDPRQSVTARITTADGGRIRLRTSIRRPDQVRRSIVGSTDPATRCGRAAVDATAEEIVQWVPLRCLPEDRSTPRMLVGARVDVRDADGARHRAVAGPYELGGLSW